MRKKKTFLSEISSQVPCSRGEFWSKLKNVEISLNEIELDKVILSDSNVDEHKKRGFKIVDGSSGGLQGNSSESQIMKRLDESKNVKKDVIQ